LLSGCCVTAGLTIGGDRYIDYQYLEHFAYDESRYLGDIGIRLIEKKGRIYVSRTNPFFVNNPFLEGDELIAIDGEKIKSLESLWKNILFSPQDRVMRVTVKRDGKRMDLNVVVGIRRGGGFLSDTFMENLGVWFDSNLTVTNVRPHTPFYKLGLRGGYKLQSINGKIMSSNDDVQKYFSKMKPQMAEKFVFVFKNKNRKITLQLHANRKYFKNIRKTEFSSFGSFGGSIGSFGVGVGNFDVNNSYFDIYNSVPLDEYLISY
jgi:membrane-associated protease RseP (regulator of RpoE activity)